MTIDSYLALLIILNRRKEWSKLTQTVQEREVWRRQLIKLFGICKLLVLQEEEARNRMWVRPIFKEKQRLLQGASDNLATEMELDELEMFYNYCRMSAGIFDKLLRVLFGQSLKNSVSFEIQYQPVPGFYCACVT